MLSRSTILLGLFFALAIAPGVAGQHGERAADRFTFKAGDEAHRLDLVISRWSTDMERDSVFATAQKEPAKTMDVLKGPGTVGYIHLPGGLDHTIRYARRVTRPDGSTDIVALAEGAVWIWWDPKAAIDTTDKYPFTIVQLHLGKAGTGEGKLSATKASADKEAGIVISDYSSAPTLLTDLRRDSASS